MDESAPVAKENDITPMSISSIQMSCSPTLYAVMSPNPTVTMVVTVK